ncbi:hypothetical protein BCV69DRAFT_70166 [Microstroma glucosiphilum]|uniref:GIY-YIG domain-containing protein n=1 Tax=Pseudomicrostroma glucosiphilum TaxID=1684307 RepID=A0A316U1F5_9BASI|nr:hypothetical protein BCV69DRAFT_70166 [Pseudomicrostroma glucosiphilum]PWN18684.1 hypothetical protein BCV69DRAFT_70166 [Pseudomicrostroma glucosiphilum]
MLQAADNSAQRDQMTLDLAEAIAFCRGLDDVAQCPIVEELWGEATPLDLATVAVRYMSDASIEYVQGLVGVTHVEGVWSHKPAGVYELLIDCDDTRGARYIGKSDHGVRKRMISHMSACRRGKKSTLYNVMRAFEERPCHQVLLVGLPISNCALKDSHIEILRLTHKPDVYEQSVSIPP